jgi:hypothetical protein
VIGPRQNSRCSPPSEGETKDIQGRLNELVAGRVGQAAVDIPWVADQCFGGWTLTFAPWRLFAEWCYHVCGSSHGNGRPAANLPWMGPRMRWFRCFWTVQPKVVSKPKVNSTMPRLWRMQSNSRSVMTPSLSHWWNTKEKRRNSWKSNWHAQVPLI